MLQNVEGGSKIKYHVSLGSSLKSIGNYTCLGKSIGVGFSPRLHDPHPTQVMGSERERGWRRGRREKEEAHSR